MARYILILSILISCLNGSGQVALASDGVSCMNYLRIEGKTNVSDFGLDQYVTNGYICGPGSSNWVLNVNKGRYEIRIPVRNFNATNKMVYSDFLHLLDVAENPYIEIYVSEAQFQKFYNQTNLVKSLIGIRVAGVIHYYEISCSLKKCQDQSILILGYSAMKLTDFNLTPPRKTLGLIKVNNELIINFEFTLPDNSALLTSIK